MVNLNFKEVVDRSEESFYEVLQKKISRKDLERLCKVPFLSAKAILEENREVRLLTPLGTFRRQVRDGYTMYVPSKGYTEIPTKSRVRFTPVNTLK